MTSLKLTNPRSTDYNIFNVISAQNLQTLWDLSGAGLEIDVNEELDYSPSSAKIIKITDKKVHQDRKLAKLRKLVTIFSDIKVSWSPNKLRNILKDSLICNISSTCIQHNFPALVIKRARHKKVPSPSVSKEAKTFISYQEKEIGFDDNCSSDSDKNMIGKSPSSLAFTMFTYGMQQQEFIH